MLRDGCSFAGATPSPAFVVTAVVGTSSVSYVRLLAERLLLPLVWMGEIMGGGHGASLMMLPLKGVSVSQSLKEGHPSIW